MDAVHNKIKENNRNYLFILDNVDDYEIVKNYVNSRPHNLKFLITSREKIKDPIISLQIFGFTDEQTQAYIKKILKGAVND